MMFNVTHLRRTHPVILISDYLRLHNLPADTEGSNGAWLRREYHDHANVFESNPERKPSLRVIENGWFDPDDIIRVDMLPTDMKIRGNWSDTGGDSSRGWGGFWENDLTTTINSFLHAALPKDKSLLSWEEALTALQAAIAEENKTQLQDMPSTDEEVERLLQLNGWEILYTFRGP